MDGLGCGAEVNAWRLGSRDKVSGRQSASTYKWCRPDAARSCTRVPRQAFRNRNTLPDRTDRSGNAVCRRVTDVLLIRGALGVVQRRSTGRSTRPSWPRLTRGVLAFAFRASLARHAGGSASDHPSLTGGEEASSRSRRSRFRLPGFARPPRRGIGVGLPLAG